MFFLLSSSFWSLERVLVSCVLIVILPFDGSSSKANKCNREDFPDPEGPTKATSSPS